MKTIATIKHGETSFFRVQQCLETAYYYVQLVMNDGQTGGVLKSYKTMRGVNKYINNY